MDFDDMPDSYFAFLSNQKKVAEPEKINGVIKEFSPSDGEKSKIRSRVGTTSLTGGSVSSLPSVPSLPSISRTSPGSSPGIRASGSSPKLGGTGTTQPSMSGIRSTGTFTNPGTRPGGFTTNPGTNPGGGAAAMVDRAPIVQPKSSAVIYVLVAVLLAAIAVLAFLLLSGK
jgi:hypothetical protein